MYLEAVELMEDDGKETMALDIFRQAIGTSVVSELKHGLFPQLQGCLFLDNCDLTVGAVSC